jgi:hypothetical protein
MNMNNNNGQEKAWLANLNKNAVVEEEEEEEPAWIRLYKLQFGDIR